MELIIRFVAMAVNVEPVGVLCVASSTLLTTFNVLSETKKNRRVEVEGEGGGGHPSPL